jgi:hypothetical protein
LDVTGVVEKSKLREGFVVPLVVVLLLDGAAGAAAGMAIDS